VSDRDFVVRREESGGGEHRLVVDVPQNLRWFEGHFEGRPMLPGVAQVVALADAHARRLVRGLGPALRLQRVKFTAVVTPGEALALTLTEERKEGEVLVRWRLERTAPPSGEALASSGTLVYAPA